MSLTEHPASATSHVETIISLVDELVETLHQVDADLGGLEADADQLARLHVAIAGMSGNPGQVVSQTGLRHAVDLVASTVETLFIRRVGEGGGVTLGSARAYVAPAKERPRADWDRLLPAVARKAEEDWLSAVDPDTGQVPDGMAPLEVHVARHVGKVVGATPSNAPRKNACKALGLRADDFVDYELGQPRLAWTSADTRTRHPKGAATEA